MSFWRFAAAVAVVSIGAAASAKPLVYCADASPEGFDPSLWDSTSTSNVTSQLFNGLVGFERAGHQARLHEIVHALPDCDTREGEQGAERSGVRVPRSMSRATL